MISGTSPWKKKLGQQVASPLVKIELVAEHPELPGTSQLSGDGYVAENMPVIEGGVLKISSSAAMVPVRLVWRRSANSGGSYVFGNGRPPCGN